MKPFDEDDMKDQMEVILSRGASDMLWWRLNGNMSVKILVCTTHSNEVVCFSEFVYKKFDSSVCFTRRDAPMVQFLIKLRPVNVHKCLN